jgi:aminoglycoside phosphotransferase family enzyme
MGVSERKKVFGVARPIRRLLALDCIDFNRTEFYHIDTLSDVAMLAVDIEMWLPYWLHVNTGSIPDKKPAQRFLDHYLFLFQDRRNELVESLLAYYMTEKAVVCTFITTLYEKSYDLSLNYLRIAHQCAKRLDAVLASHRIRSGSNSSSSTHFVTPGVAIRHG